MDLHIRNRVFIVTGGSRGIGLAITRFLVAEGAKVAICADALEKATGQCSPDSLFAGRVDVLDSDAMSRFVRNAHDRFERLDGVVANAGAGTSGTILEATKDDWMDQFSIKILSVTNLVNSSLPFLKLSDAARIVIMNSVTATKPEPSMAVVSAARAAVGNLAQTLAIELAPAGITVNTVSLGAIETERQRERHKRSESDLDYETWRQEQAAARRIAMGRFGKPEEVAPFVALCLSPLSSYVTGASIGISGGL